MELESVMIETLQMIAGAITEEAKQKKDWGHFGNSLGRSESKQKCEFWAEILLSIAEHL